jgi:hypothetical protein
MEAIVRIKTGRVMGLKPLKKKRQTHGQGKSLEVEYEKIVH